MNIKISCDKSLLDVDFIYQYLHHHAYWCEGIPKKTVIKSIENSLCFGVFIADEQIGFARVVSDFATFGYLADVFISPNHRGQGYSKILIDKIMSHPELQGLRRFSLNTADAHGLYRRVGFTDLSHPERGMEIAKPGMYLNSEKLTN